MSQFYRVPKALYTGEYFHSILFEAKAIYSMKIDRVSLSIKNGWLDEDGKTYIHYSVADIMADTGCGKNKVLKCLKKVEESVEKDSEVCNVNLKAYLLAALFNAGTTMSNYYRTEVNDDMPQFAG